MEPTFINPRNTYWRRISCPLFHATLHHLVVRTFSERNHHLFTIPAGVWHGPENVGTTDAVFLNFPTTPYNHDKPDKLDLPVKNDLIPFAFGITRGLPGAG